MVNARATNDALPAKRRCASRCQLQPGIRPCPSRCRRMLNMWLTCFSLSERGGDILLAADVVSVPAYAARCELMTLDTEKRHA